MSYVMLNLLHYNYEYLFLQLGGRQEPVLEPSKYSAVDVRIVSSTELRKLFYYLRFETWTDI